MLRRLTAGMCAATAVAALAAIDTTPAVAASTVSFSLSPSTAQAGAAATLTTSASFSPASGDDPKSVTLALAPGLLSNPTVPVACTEAQFQQDSCPAGSQIGTGSITATLLGLPSTNQGKLYLLAAQTGEIGRIGMVTSTTLGKVYTEGSVTLRTSPSVGANITFNNLPNNIGGVSITVTGLSTTINGTVNGLAFTRNPTSCAQDAVTTMTVGWYTSTAPSSSSSSFRPTLCTTLPFAPQLSASEVIGSDYDSTQLTTTVQQKAGEAAISSQTLTLPSGLLPRNDYTSRECSATNLSTCPSTSQVGTATVSSPFMAAALSGKVLLTSPPSGSSNPGMAIVFPAPYAMVFRGTSTVGGNGLTTTVTGLPDMPMTSTVVTMTGGSDSLLTGGWTQCFGSNSISGKFGDLNSRSFTSNATVATSGC